MQQAVRTPYVTKGPVELARQFYGREALFAWVGENLRADPPLREMVLTGEATIGKSSVLHQLAAERLGAGILPVLVDLAQLETESQSRFYRELAETAVARLVQAGLKFPDLDRKAFVNNPAAAFNQQVVHPLVGGNGEQKILFLLDHVESISEKIEQGLLAGDTLTTVAHMLHQAPVTYALFACAPLADSEETTPTGLQENATRYELGPLAEEAALSMMQEPVPYTLVKDVSDYIYALTGGWPQQLQEVCAGIYQRQMQFDLQQITIADVVTVWRTPAVVRGARVGTSRALLPFHAESSDSKKVKIDTESIPRRASMGLWLVVLLLIAMVFLTAVNVWQNRDAAVLASQPTTQPTAAATATAVIIREIIIAEPTAIVLPTATATTIPTRVVVENLSPAVMLEPTPAATATVVPTLSASNLPEEIVRVQDGMEMRLIPAGSFLMGAADEDFVAGSDEKPRHLVRLDAFYLDRYEVTVEQYAAFLNHLGEYERACNKVDCTLPRGRIGYTSYLLEDDLGDGTVTYTPVTGFARYPINHVSWHGAVVYCEYVGGRLPTEAEWEYAARGDDNRAYPWGNDAPNPSLAVYQSQSFDNLKAVDALPAGASPFDVLGMAGSMWEWTADWYNELYYESSPAQDPAGPENGFTRVLRGGAWPFNNQSDRIRATNRYALDPAHISSTVGFRCAVDP